MADTTTIVSSSQLLGALVAGGLLGMAGQGIRSLAGLKKMNDDAKAAKTSSSDMFSPSRFLISLIIGFIAGVLAAVALGLQKFTSFDLNQPSVLSGVILAGYSGTDFIEAIAANFVTRAASQRAETAKPDKLDASAQGKTNGQPANAPSGNGALLLSNVTAPGGVAELVGGLGPIHFGALVPGGFFSDDPFNLHVHRSIRTNNPGAINFSSWQKTRLGYVGVTQPDNSPDHNVTTIYRTPEHGVAAWYHLLTKIYGFSPGTQFSVLQLAQRYAGRGTATDPNVITYLSGWSRWSHGDLVKGTMIDLAAQDQSLVLAKAVFSHEASMETPLEDQQIVYGMVHEADNTLPS